MTKIKDNNLVSVIIPSYNSGRYIDKTIESVLNQTYSNFEIIIIDDNSTDETPQILRYLEGSNSKVKCYFLKENMGSARARNYGIENSKGRYIAFLDSDDLWVNNKLEKQINFMNNSQERNGFSYTAYQRIDESNNLINSIKVPKNITHKELLKNTIIGCSTVIIDRLIVGDFRMVDIRKGQDTATWLQILKTQKNAFGLNEELTLYKVREGSISSDKIGALKRTWDIYRKVEKMSLVETSYYFSHYIKNALIKRITIFK